MPLFGLALCSVRHGLQCFCSTVDLCVLFLACLWPTCRVVACLFWSHFEVQPGSAPAAPAVAFSAGNASLSHASSVRLLNHFVM
jgi:hypothetical protein